MSDIAFSDLQESKPFRLEKSGKAICVVKVGQEVFAIDDTCSHSDASLSEGDVEKFAVECWLPGAAFDLRTGERVNVALEVAFKVARNKPVKVRINSALRPGLQGATPVVSHDGDHEHAPEGRFELLDAGRQQIG